MDIVNISLGQRSYKINIAPNLLNENGIADMVKPYAKSNVFIITDSNVYKCGYTKILEQQFEGAFIHVVEAGEASKSWAKLQDITEMLIKHKAERSSLIIALGGGVIGDLAGFVASITLRGINFIQIPTSLLAQVDSSVGGKTAINSQHGKNLIGAFYQPKQVVIDTNVLKTLPKRELLSGYAEIVKYGLLGDIEFFEWLETNAKKVIDQEQEALTYAIKRSCQMKADIVSQDEKEGGKRALLNLGHTFGHAFEAETGMSDKLLHGEAVALGILCAFKLSTKLGYTNKQDEERIEKHFKAIGLPTNAKNYIDNWNAEKLVEHMYSDKKVSGGNLVFILNKKIGESFIAKDISPQDVIEVLS